MKRERRFFASKRGMLLELGIVAVMGALLYVFRDRNPLGVLLVFITVSVLGGLLIMMLVGFWRSSRSLAVGETSKRLPSDAGKSSDG